MDLDISIVRPGRDVVDLFKTESGRSVHPVNAIFPIFHITDVRLFVPLGTGFFVNPSSVFATAKHVVTDREGNLLENLIGVQIVRDGREVFACPRLIGNVTLHRAADVAVGSLLHPLVKSQVAPADNFALELTAYDPIVDERISTFAMPQPAAIEQSDGTFELQFAPRLIRGRIVKPYPNGRDSTRPGNCFQTSMHIEGGASGGPVFCSNERVFSVNSSGFSFPESDMDIEGSGVTFVTSVKELLDLSLDFRAEVNALPARISLPIKRLVKVDD